ncbi:peptidylprolyl isomerase [Odoribacter lunatus]|uniref:peptidylprolyl isomerase n=1 Tax=Odoribacter lunatus TaxID=2941335 RepID=UPI00203B165D|nr:peptidylprolyl isomerase [Odoribacter lunatus]
MKYFLIILLAVLFLIGCRRNEENTFVIKTNVGEIHIRLYDVTPEHRDNFVKLVKEKYYEGMLFHRVIPDFVIQTGDPASRNARSQMILGAGDIGYKIDAEIRPELIHKRGVIAAAREGDNVNPERRSSGSHFYIVQGHVYRPGELDSVVEQINFRRQQTLFDKVKQQYEVEIRAYESAKDYDALMELNKKISEQVSELFAGEKFILTEEQRKSYTTEGGIPFLDGAYTIFGEVTKGMDVVDRITKLKTDENNRPERDVKIIEIK